MEEKCLILECILREGRGGRKGSTKEIMSWLENSMEIIWMNYNLVRKDHYGVSFSFWGTCVEFLL